MSLTEWMQPTKSVHPNKRGVTFAIENDLSPRHPL